MHVLHLRPAEQLDHTHAIDWALKHDQIICSKVFGRVCIVAHLEQAMLREVLKENIVGVLIECGKFFVRSL